MGEILCSSCMNKQNFEMMSDLGLALITEVEKLRKEITTYRSEQYLVEKQSRELETLREEVERLREFVKKIDVMVYGENIIELLRRPIQYVSVNDLRQALKELGEK